MVLAQIRKQAFLEVVRQTGLRGLYVGFSTTLYRDISFNMVFFPSREIFVRWFAACYGERPDPWSRVLLGYPSGIMSAVVSCPYDVVKTRMQGNELGKSWEVAGAVLWSTKGHSEFSKAYNNGIHFFLSHKSYRL